MLLEKVIALREVKPVNRSSQPAFSQPASSARKTVSGFPGGSRLVSANRSSGMTRPPCQTNSQPFPPNGERGKGEGRADTYAIRSKIALDVPKVSESHARLSDIAAGRPNITLLGSATSAVLITRRDRPPPRGLA